MTDLQLQRHKHHSKPINWGRGTTLDCTANARTPRKRSALGHQPVPKHACTAFPPPGRLTPSHPHHHRRHVRSPAAHRYDHAADRMAEAGCPVGRSPLGHCGILVVTCRTRGHRHPWGLHAHGGLRRGEERGEWGGAALQRMSRHLKPRT